MRIFKNLLLALCLITCTALSVNAEELSVWRDVKASSPDTPTSALFDGSHEWYQKFAPGHSVSVKYSEGFGGLYVLFYDTPDA